MEHCNKNTTNAETLTSERERSLAKENGETQQASINDENMQDYDDQQPSEKDIVQPEDISNAPTEKCLGNVGNKWDNCRGQLFDNAANMSGRYNGVRTLLKEKNKFTNYAPCAAHSLNLVAAELVKVATEIVSFFGLV
ncbi:zinc finger MYM-type protein 1 [Trichonephila clavipes]|nr:zinc finger MYM-type protein 1 [Trichonephila clavipes]